MKEPVKMGRHAEIVPGDGSHYVLVGGQEWSRHDDLAVAEAVRNAIVEGWAAEYERRADKWMPGLAYRILRGREMIKACPSDAGRQKSVMAEEPVVNLRPGSWTDAEVEAMIGCRVRFQDGHMGYVKNAAALVHDNEIYMYAVEVTPNGGQTIILSKGDGEKGDWAFTVPPDPPLTEEERNRLPEWGAKP
jgi:hypothetical protein